ncbi:hypothetical protein KTO58_15850 [Chitinophaga pendula]|uniref:hypothetical protein n=1 Tax=Chitinophaga TaxID=79328 RepID=UPI000BAFD59B|nr:MULTISPECIES: hypothetical protein [Chitinophaga]ASZ11812.1 hypothetical protein CK934_13005 [Chitinophaga sp. MD30]UCJ05168.1 hypothetical protein KTO58_15850 [Chitinophaga pendula]
MKKLLLLSLVIGLASLSCKKDKLSSKPALTFLSYSTSEINKQIPGMIMYINVKDGDGDVEQNIYFQIILKSKTLKDTVPFEPRQMPKLEASKGTRLDAEIQMTLARTDLDVAYTGGPWDSVNYRLYINDNAGNISDTIVTPKLPIRN